MSKGVTSMGEHDHSNGVSECKVCQEEARRHFERGVVDDGPWDGPAAMGRCAASSNPAESYAAICAGRIEGDPKRGRSWAFPHHARVGAAPNEMAVVDALNRLKRTPGITNRSAAEKHLQAHMKAIREGRQEHHHDEPHDEPVPEEPARHEDIHQQIEQMITDRADGSQEEAPVMCGRNEPCLPKAKDNLYRAVFPGMAVRKVDSPNGSDPAGSEPNVTEKKTPAPGFTGDELHGHFAVFNQWTEIDSIFEGRFLECVAPGACTKTFKENKDRMRCLFQHGRDYRIGDKPLGPIDEVREDDVGAAYKVPLLDTAYNHELIPGLREGLYGASFRFRVTREELVEKPEKSARNPEGIPERTIKEMEVKEFGPVTFPAYQGATAGVRSITDEMILGDYMRDPDKLREIIRSLPGLSTKDAISQVNRDQSSEPPTTEEPKLPELVVQRNPNKKRRHASNQ